MLDVLERILRQHHKVRLVAIFERSYLALRKDEPRRNVAPLLDDSEAAIGLG